MIEADRILQELIVTEKATELSSKTNRYTFKVYPKANRVCISQAVEKTFKVKVKRVNIIKTKPKAKRDPKRRGKLGFKGGMMKAVVSLKEGDKIEIL